MEFHPIHPVHPPSPHPSFHNYLYSREELADWAPSITRLAESAARVQLLFNNNRANYAVINGLQMAELLHLGYPPPEESLAVTPPLFPDDGDKATP